MNGFTKRRPESESFSDHRRRFDAEWQQEECRRASTQIRS
jgi:hypothetical protein